VKTNPARRRVIKFPTSHHWLGLFFSVALLINFCVDGERRGHPAAVVWSGMLAGALTLWPACRKSGLYLLWILPACLMAAGFLVPDTAANALLQGLFTGLGMLLFFWVLERALRRIGGWAGSQARIHQRRRRLVRREWTRHALTAGGPHCLAGEALLVTLVHGTFAPNAPWTAAGSSLFEATRRALGDAAQIDAFVWSGANSHAVRRQAGQSLAAFLARRAAAAPGRRHLLIAHSHGGNVALYALKLQPALAPTVAGIVTMATPFITVRRRQIHAAIRLLSWLVPPAVFIGTFVTLLSFASELPWLPFTILVTTAFVAPLVGWKPLRQWLLGPVLARLIERQRRIAEELDTVPPVQVPLLYAFVSYDEAGLGLRMLHLLGGAGHQFLVLLRLFMRIGIVTVLVVGAATIVASDYVPELHDWSRAFLERGILGLAASAGLYALCLLFSAAWPWLVRGHRYGYGNDSIWQDFLLDIGASPMPPPGVSGTPCSVPVRERKGLRHSYLYESGEFMDRLTEWLCGRVGGSCESLRQRGYLFDLLAPWLAGGLFLGFLLAA
jgi:hypothetical protein